MEVKQHLPPSMVFIYGYNKWVMTYREQGERVGQSHAEGEDCSIIEKPWLTTSGCLLRLDRWVGVSDVTMMWRHDDVTHRLILEIQRVSEMTCLQLPVQTVCGQV